MQGGVKKPPLSSKGALDLIAVTPLIPLIPVEIEGSLTLPSLPLNELGRRLLKASVDGNIEEIKLLMNKGAPFTADWLGTSPLHFAAQYNYVDVCDLLLRAGISKDARTKVDRTPLHIAASEGHLDIIKCLLKHKADIECKDLLEMTPLHWAVQNCHAEVVSFLVSEGAQTEVANKFDLTPMEIAVQCERYDILTILKSSMRDPMIAAQNLAIHLHEMDNGSYTQSELIETQPDSSPFLDSINLCDSDDKTQVECSVSIEDSNEQMLLEDENDCIITNEEVAPETKLQPPIDNKFTESLKLLQQHGITMLPIDDTSILSSVLELGRSVVLTDVGKQVLNSTKPIDQPSKTQTLSVNKKYITVTAEEFLAMSANQNKLKKVNGKLLVTQPQSKQGVKRIIMKKNKVVPFGSKVTKIFTTKQDNIMDVKTLIKQLADAKHLAEEYKKMYLKKHAEAEKYKQQILMLTGNKC